MFPDIFVHGVLPHVIYYEPENKQVLNLICKSNHSSIHSWIVMSLQGTH